MDVLERGFCLSPQMITAFADIQIDSRQRWIVLTTHKHVLVASPAPCSFDVLGSLVVILLAGKYPTKYSNSLGYVLRKLSFS
jgi:hypothetical protein